jgi:hypothetical protein
VAATVSTSSPAASTIIHRAPEPGSAVMTQCPAPEVIVLGPGAPLGLLGSLLNPLEVRQLP